MKPSPTRIPRVDADSTLKRAACLLDANPGNGYYRDIARSTAELLRRVDEIAPYWAEPYAAPVVPIIEQATRLAHLIADKHQGAPEVTG